MGLLDRLCVSRDRLYRLLNCCVRCFRLGHGRRIVRLAKQGLLAFDLLFRLLMALRARGQRDIVAVIQVFPFNDRGNLAALGALQFINDLGNGGLVEIRQIQMNVVQRLVHQDMGLKRRSDHAAKELCNIC